MKRTALLLLLPLLLGALGALAACPAPAGDDLPPADRSDGNLPTLTVPRIAPQVLTLDGRLDEPAWATAASTGSFVNPRSGRSRPGSKVNARARLACNETYLYVGIEVHDPAPETPFQRDQIDPHLWEKASAIELMLQPGDPGDNREYYEIQVDTAGAVWDTRFDDYNRPRSAGPDGPRFGHQDWQSSLVRQAHVDRARGRYTVELALPWSALKSSRTAVPPASGDTWRLNLYSFRAGQRDAMAWSPLLGRGNFHRTSRFGKATFRCQP